MERRGGGRELEMCPRVAAQAGRRHCADGAAADRAVRTAIAAASLLLGSAAAFAPLPRHARGALARPDEAACRKNSIGKERSGCHLSLGPVSGAFMPRTIGESNRLWSHYRRLK